MKILILKPSSLGDVVQALPVLRMLKRHWPASEVHWWIDSALNPLLEADRDLSGTILFHRRRWVAPRYWPEVIRSVRHIRRLAFDWVIDLQALARSGLLAWLARGRVTVGLDDWREGASALYDVRVPRPSPHTHAVDWYLEVLRVLGTPVNWDIEWLPARPAAAAAVEQKWPADGHLWLTLQPGARWPTKCWPVEHYVNLAGRLAAALPQARLAVLGGRADAELGRQISQGAPGRCLDLTGQTTLPEMVEWLRRSELLICNDSGPMHVAAALGKPVVAMFGPTDPRRTGPYGQLDRVLQLKLPCVPCLRKQCGQAKRLECLRAISPEQVLGAVLQRLAEGPVSGLQRGPQ